MNFRHLILFVFLLKSTSSHDLNRQPRLANAKSTNNDGNNASKKIKNESNYDQTVQESTRLDFFPEVEYPSSILDASKPFYLNMNPFSEDVKTSFNNLNSQKVTTQKPTIVLNLIAKNNKKDKNPTLKLVDTKSKTIELNLKSKTKENITEILDDKMDNSSLYEEKLPKNKIKTKVPKEQIAELNEYVTLTDSDIGIVNNSVIELCYEEANQNEIVTLAPLDLKLPNNDTNDIFDKYSSIELEPLLFYSSNLSMIASDYGDSILEDNFSNEPYSYESLEES